MRSPIQDVRRSHISHTGAHVVYLQTVVSAHNESIDAQKVRISATYEITGASGAPCGLAYETRDVSGIASGSYNATIISCSTQFTCR
jgi:hypothetical protein